MILTKVKNSQNWYYKKKKQKKQNKTKKKQKTKNKKKSEGARVMEPCSNFCCEFLFSDGRGIAGTTRAPTFNPLRSNGKCNFD